MSRYRYEIDESHAIRIWDNEAPNELGAPFLYQPSYPNGDAWGSVEAATAWAELYIESSENPDSELIFGNSADEPSRPRPPRPTE